MVIYMYIVTDVYCHGMGADESLGSIFFRIINIKSRRRFFFMYFHYKPMTDNDALGAWPVLTSAGARYVGFIKKDLYTLLHTKYESSRP